ncbi:MAG: sodium-translocating pyrophosphatase [Weeksellaceae bacterium]|jgi:K(+)-stimulated pyrophosphate-energized sodium pump|nr:sodium-translocating pyrophosphatase [Weeksellaceae bacterium]
MKEISLWIPVILSIVGLLMMGFKFMWVNKQDAGNERMQSISKNIQDGALAFLSAEYRLLLIFVAVASLALFGISRVVDTTSWLIVPAFIIGAIFSALAGNVGMRVATAANVRTTQAARSSLPQALKVSFSGGTVMGLGVAGLAVLGLSLFFILFTSHFLVGEKTFYDEMTIALEALAGFSLGAESIALFARVGGGIYTKAADVGADLVGKVEAGIPEDDPRNPATIADNVGDNVGDVAGMGADLFGSYVATVLASMVLGNYIIKDYVTQNGVPFEDDFGGMGPIILPIMIAGVGIIASIIGTFLVKVSNGEVREAGVQKALNLGNWTSIVLIAISGYFLINWMLPEKIYMSFFGEGIMIIPRIYVFYATLIGLAVGGLISAFTEYYTGLGKKPVLNIVKNSSTGAATNIIAGLATGMMSTFSSVLLFAAAIWGSYELAGFYGVAIAASAMMATTAMQLAIDAFGPIADNAGGIAEMSELPKEVRERTDILDSVGNTTAAVGKGFAIASAALTALALFAAYVTFTGIDGINIFKAKTLAALFVGGMIPVVFSALAMESVGKAAMAMVQEVRRQFKEIPGILEGTGTPEYGKCVEISTKAALREMMLPGALTIVTPVLIGFVMGAEALGAYMAGVAVSGVLWAIFQNNAGGAWDNAKKSFEAGVEIDGKMTYKGSEAHKAAVTGDTVGDPFKDTSGPSMNILIKLTCLVGLVIAPILGEKENSNFVDVSKTEEVREPQAILAVSESQNVDKEGNYIINSGDLVDLELPSGQSIQINRKSSESRLFRYFSNPNILQQGARKKSNAADWIILDKIYFKANSAEMLDRSEVQIKNIFILMKEFPEVKIKIGGFMNDSGNENDDLKLSTVRADVVKQYLVKFGIDENRIQSEGYGSAEPICTDKTDICDAQNRRIGIRMIAG